MKIRLRRRPGFTLVELLVVITIILVLAGIAYPKIMDARRAGDIVKTTNNAKQVQMALNDFSGSFQSYPDDDTAERIEENPALKKVDGCVLTGDTANPYLRQLIVAGKITDEGAFFGNLNSRRARTRQPDRKVANGAALERGENIFCYVMYDLGDGNRALTETSGDPGEPILVTMVNETSNGGTATYDKEALNGKVFILRKDNSAQTEELDDNGVTPNVFRQDLKGRDTAQDYKILRADV